MELTKCRVLSPLSHDGNVFGIGCEVYLPDAIAQRLAIQKVVEIVSKPEILSKPDQREEASPVVVSPPVDELPAVAKKKS